MHLAEFRKEDWNSYFVVSNMYLFIWGLLFWKSINVFIQDLLTRMYPFEFACVFSVKVGFWRAVVVLVLLVSRKLAYLNNDCNHLINNTEKPKHCEILQCKITVFFGTVENSSSCKQTSPDESLRYRSRRITRCPQTHLFMSPSKRFPRSITLETSLFFFKFSEFMLNTELIT